MQATTSTHRRIHANWKISLAGLGCNNFGWHHQTEAQTTKKVVDAALEAGINFFDTADIYDEGHSENFSAARSADGGAKR